MSSGAKTEVVCQPPSLHLVGHPDGLAPTCVTRRQPPVRVSSNTAPSRLHPPPPTHDAQRPAAPRNYLCDNDLRRLARRGGVLRIGTTALDAARAAVRSFVDGVIRDASALAEHGRRFTVTATDVALSLKRRGVTVYGGEIGHLGVEAGWGGRGSSSSAPGRRPGAAPEAASAAAAATPGGSLRASILRALPVGGEGRKPVPATPADSLLATVRADPEMRRTAVRREAFDTTLRELEMGQHLVLDDGGSVRRIW